MAVAVKLADPSTAIDCAGASAVATVLPAASRICQLHLGVLRLLAFVLDHRAKRQSVAELPLTAVRTVALPLAQVQRIGLGQPHVAIDARALVEPAVAEAGVHARHDVVLRAVAQKVRQVEAERRVAVVVAADEAAVHKDQHVAEGAVELDRDAPAQVAGRNLELAPVPAHAGLRIAAAEGLVAVRFLLLVAHKGQLDRPVVRQVQRAPLGVVELGLGKVEVAGLGKVSLAVAEAQIAGRIGAVAKLELPAEVEEQLLAGRNGRQRLGRSSPGITSQQCGGARPGRTGQQR